MQKELSSTQNKNEIPLLYCHRTLKAKAPYLNLNCDNLLETTNKVDISSLFKTPESENSNENIIEEEIKHLSLCCTDSNTLIDGIIYACDIHSKRI